MSTIHDDQVQRQDSFDITETGPERLAWDRFGSPLLRPFGIVCVVASTLALFAGLLVGIALLSSLVSLPIDLTSVLTWVPETSWTPTELTWTLLGSAVLLQGCGALVLLPRFSRSHMVIFLRKFRHSNASRAVTEAAIRTGGNWRFISLDDAEMEPTGGNRGLLITTLVIGYLPALLNVLSEWIRKILSWLAKKCFRIALVGLILGGILHLFTDDEKWVSDLTRISALVLGIVIAAWLLKWAFILLFALPTFLMMSIVSTDSGKWAKATSLKELQDIRSTINPKKIDQVFAPKFRVVEVGIEFWRTAVSGVSVIATVPLVDVSEPTDAILWEIAEMSNRFGPRCVFVGHQPQIETLRESDDPIAVRLRQILRGKRVLVYTSDPMGLRRFAHALRATIESNSRHPLPVAAQTDPLEDIGAASEEPDETPAQGVVKGSPESPVIVRSYSDVDRSIASQLIETLSANTIECVLLENESPTVWELDTKSRIESCAALVLVLSDPAMELPSVERDLVLSKEYARPMVPVIVSGAIPAVLELHSGAVRFEDSDFQENLVTRLREALAGDRPQRSGELIGSGLPIRNRFFKGRESVLARLAADTHETHGLTVTLICGEGGVGKTEIAAEFVYRSRSAYDFVGWLDARWSATVPQQLAQLAPHLGVDVSADTPLRAVAEAVLEALAATTKRWCLVLDDLSASSDLANLLTSGGSGHVIVTSRDPVLEAVSLIIVDPLPRRDAVELLRARAGSLEVRVADEICAVLGDLPLVVDQAGAFISQSHMTGERYLAKLADAVRQLGSESEAELSRLRASAVWMVTRAHLDSVLHRRRRQAVGLLELCSFLSPSVLTPAVFTSDFGSMAMALKLSGAIQFSQAVDILAHYALVRRGHSRGSMITNNVTASVVRHRAVQRADQGYGRFVKKAATAMSQTLGGQRMKKGVLFESPSNAIRWVQLLPHAIALLSHLPAGHREEGVMEVAVRASDYLCQQEQFYSAMTILENVLVDLRRFKGDEYHRTRDVRAKLAEAYGAEGGLPGAVDLTAQRREHRQSMLGAGFLEVLSARRSRAYRLDKEGQHEAAIELYEEVVRIRRGVLGEDHDFTLATRNDLALVHLRLGRTEASIEILEDIGDVRLRSGRQEDAETLTTLSNLASAYTEAGRLEEAIATHERVLANRWRLFGGEHPDTLITLNNFAFTLERIGHIDTALTLFAHAFAIRRRTLGIDDPDTMSSQSDFKHVHELHKSGRRGGDLPGRPAAEPSQPEPFHAYQRLSASLPEVLRADLLSSLSSLAVEMAALGLIEQAFAVATEGIGIQRLLEQDSFDGLSQGHVNLRATLIRLCKHHRVYPTASILASVEEAVRRLGELASEAPEVHADGYIEAMEALITLRNRHP